MHKIDQSYRESYDLVMAFDYGLKYTGVAVGQRVTGTARGTTTLKSKNGTPNWRDLKAEISTHKPHILIVGLPLNMDGTESDMSDHARNFAEDLAAKTELKVLMVDERLTSHAADAALKDARLAGQSKTDHELAACFIAQTWLADQRKP